MTGEMTRRSGHCESDDVASACREAGFPVGGQSARWAHAGTEAAQSGGLDLAGDSALDARSGGARQHDEAVEFAARQTIRALAFLGCRGGV